MKLLKKIAAGFLLTFLAGFIFALPFQALQSAKAYSFDWTISSFDANIQIQKDGSMKTTETIITNFSPESSHHGIYRYIPVDYKDDFGNRVTIEIHVLSVQDDKGNDWPYDLSKNSGNLNIKIGDPKTYIHGQNIFKITYTVDRALLFLEDHDELYWNVTGDKWDVDIQKASATVTVPPEIQQKDLKAICYTGAYGSKDKNCTFNIQNNIVQINSTGSFNYGEGMTIAIGFPKGVIVAPTLTQQILWFLIDNWGYGLPIITFIVLFYFWYTRGHDPRDGLKTTIMPYYEAPDNLTPGEVGTIIDETVDMRDVTAGIIDMAVRGYIRIKELKEKDLIFERTDYELELLKDYTVDQKIQNHERTILTGIFNTGKTHTKIKLSDLKNKFYTYIPDIQKNIYDATVANGYFSVSPDKVRKIYLGVGMALVAIGFFGFIWYGAWVAMSISIPLGVGLSGAITMIFSKFMPVKTKKGVETFYKIKGLEEFINTAEKDRLKFQEKENLFEKLLPYAMAFGIAGKWSKAFEGIYKSAPGWFVSSNPNFTHNFSTFYFVNSLNSLSTNMQQTLASAPRASGSGGFSGGGFGGGGFSGGGFGGGGGGAW